MATVLMPIATSQSAMRSNITGEGLKRLHRFVAEICAHRNDMKSRSNVDARRTVMDDRQPRRLP